jgi:uroporphyrinogen decarboxylase
MVGERGLVNLYINSPLDHQAGWAVDVPDLMIACYDNPKLVTDLLRLFQERTLAEMRAALEAGVEVIFVPWYFASISAGWSPRLYQSLFLPLLREQVDLVHGMGGLYHYYDDGAVTRLLPWLAQSGIDLLSSFPPAPMGDFNMADAKARYGKQICFNGNIDLINVIKNGTPESIQTAVRQLIYAGAPGGGFILGTSDSIRDTDLANVRAFFEAGRLYGDYASMQVGSYAQS